MNVYYSKKPGFLILDSSGNSIPNDAIKVVINNPYDELTNKGQRATFEEVSLYIGESYDIQDYISIVNDKALLDYLNYLYNSGVKNIVLCGGTVFPLNPGDKVFSNIEQLKNELENINKKIYLSYNLFEEDLSKFSVSYSTERGILNSGNFSDVPLGVFKSAISTNYIKLTDDQIHLSTKSFSVYVGITYNIDDFSRLTLDEEWKNRIENYRKKGVQKLVLCHGTFYPLYEQDRVFDTYDEMKDFINSLGNEVKYVSKGPKM